MLEKRRDGGGGGGRGKRKNINLRSASESASFEQTSEKELAGGPLGCSIGLVLRPRGVRGGGGGGEGVEG